MDSYGGSLGFSLPFSVFQMCGMVYHSHIALVFPGSGSPMIDWGYIEVGISCALPELHFHLVLLLAEVQKRPLIL